jgi:S-(hydroxymethyl)glutathione dehydrogenase/alcohol dehydrogenase
VKTLAAVTYGINQDVPFVVKEIELDDPKDDEVLVHMVAAGLCHSDWHFVVGEQYIGYWPMVLGHEGAGVVAQVGKNVTHVKPGDHVVLSYIPTCAKCEWCLEGHSRLCNDGADILNGPQPDKTFRMHDDDGSGIGQACYISTFSEWSVVPKMSVVKVSDHYRLERAALVACGVVAGAGAALYVTNIKPGSCVAVWGVGGVGMNVVQGARLRGAREIVAVDIHDWKLEEAKKFGATHGVNASKQDPVEYIRELTWGRGADTTFEVIATEETIAQALAATSKIGTCVVVGLNHYQNKTVSIDPTMMVLYERTLKGSMYGGAVPHTAIPRFLRMWDDGLLNLDDLVTKEYRLEDIGQGYQDQLDGKLTRGIIRYDWDYR